MAMKSSRRPRSLRFMAALACAAALSGGLRAADGATVKACGHHDYPPWNWKQGSEIVGVCATVAKRAIERLGYRVDLGYVGPWKRCQELVATGEVDVNICAFRNAERERYSVFAEPRMGQNRVSIFVGPRWHGERRFEQWQDLAGLRTAVVLGVSMGQAFDAFLVERTKVQHVTTVRQVLLMLEADRIDFVPFGHEAGLMEIERNGLAGRIVPLAKPALVGDLYLSVSRKSPLARRLDDIGAYFSRPDYPRELATLLEEQQRRYIDSRPSSAGQPASVGGP
jgi:polar amino acid transport system substrate-binding protein